MKLGSMLLTIIGLPAALVANAYPENQVAPIDETVGSSFAWSGEKTEVLPLYISR